MSNRASEQEHHHFDILTFLLTCVVLLCFSCEVGSKRIIQDVVERSFRVGSEGVRESADGMVNLAFGDQLLGLRENVVDAHQIECCRR